MASIQQIYAGHVASGLASFELEPPDLAEIRRRYAAVLAQGLPYLVAEAAGRIAGYAYAGPYHARPAYRFSLEDSVYVAPDFAGRGIGSLLLAELISRATAGGYRQMVAMIGDSANQASIRLHARHGFRETGVLTDIGYKFGRWVDSVLMQRSLGPGAETAPGRD
ncbi:MAG: GNAT family N-acetyltransferase [Kiloniellales bacterium]